MADRSYTRGDALNITGITDNVTAGLSQSFGYTAANRLSAATGPYGSLAWGYDGVGNRTSETAAGITDTYVYPGTSNRIQSIGFLLGASDAHTHPRPAPPPCGR